MKSHPCAICAHPATMKCAGCKKPYYCSREHQQKAWPKHKALCKIYQSQNPPTPNTYCGLCGKQGPLKTTECCNRYVCNTSESDFSGNILDICSRNHSNYTLCGLHHKLHPNDTCDWRECLKCKDHLKYPERFVGHGTSQYNFDSDWEDPSTFEPKSCAQCGKLLKLNIEAIIFRADGTCICQKHQQIPASVAKRLLSGGNFKVESFGIS